MTGPVLPGIPQLAGRLAAEVAHATVSAEALWQVTGPPTAGKSALLVALAQHLTQNGLAPVIVAPPAAQLDSGGVALVQIGAGLKAGGFVNGESAVFVDALSWGEKLHEVRSWVETNADKVVLLCDEPLAWPSRSPEGSHFASHAEEVSRVFVETIACRRVATGRLPDSTRPKNRHSLQPRSAPVAWLMDGAAWGNLADAARGLGGIQDLERHSPLEIRLLVAIAAVAGAHCAAQLATGGTARREIARTLADLIEHRSDLRPFAETWGRMALVRRPLEAALVDRLASRQLSALARDILEKCLLYPNDDRYVLHETLRLDARERAWLAPPAVKETHRTLARHYVEAFRAAPDTAGALRNELEAFHHAAQAADTGLSATLRPFFTDQLDVLGRELSRSGEYAAAVAVFERSLGWDEDNDYAQHYLAFNLDIQGREPQRVERHYQLAVELDRLNTWWRTRWVNYLVTRGRMVQARQAWNDALDSLGLPDPEAPAWIYENLHIWVARLLLHRGQLDFAQEVLGGIPCSVREEHFGLRALARTLARLVEVRDARAVFPLTIAADDWWKGPHLSARRTFRGAQLERWLPGRVDRIDEDGVHLAVAIPPPEAGEHPAYGFIDFSVADFDRYSRDERAAELEPGRFVEVAYYLGVAEPIIRVHAERAWEDGVLPPLFPDPVRYMRTTGWVR